MESNPFHKAGLLTDCEEEIISREEEERSRKKKIKKKTKNHKKVDSFGTRTY